MWYHLKGALAFIHLNGINGKGKFGIVDADDIEGVGEHNTRWTLNREGGYVQAWSKINKGKVYLHHVIMGKPEKPLVVNHIDHNPLNNVKSNLEIITKSEDLRHRRTLRAVTSLFKGVSWDMDTGKWRATISIEGKSNHLGLFANELDAARAYRSACHENGIFLTEPNWGELDSKPNQVNQNVNTINNYFAPKN